MKCGLRHFGRGPFSLWDRGAQADRPVPQARDPARRPRADSASRSLSERERERERESAPRLRVYIDSSAVRENEQRRGYLVAPRPPFARTQSRALSSCSCSCPPTPPLNLPRCTSPERSRRRSQKAPTLTSPMVPAAKNQKRPRAQRP